MDAPVPFAHAYYYTNKSNWVLCSQDYESLKDHLKGEAVKEFIKYTAKENVRYLTL